MSHPIPNTHDSHSAQVILPQKQLGRKSDMLVSHAHIEFSCQISNVTTICEISIFRYLFCCSYSHNIAPKGKHIAFVLTEAETDDPQTELKPGIDLLGPVDEIFFDTYDRFEPTNLNDDDNCFISTVINN